MAGFPRSFLTTFGYLFSLQLNEIWCQKSSLVTKLCLKTKSSMAAAAMLNLFPFQYVASLNLPSLEHSLPSKYFCAYI